MSRTTLCLYLLLLISSVCAITYTRRDLRSSSETKQKNNAQDMIYRNRKNLLLNQFNRRRQYSGFVKHENEHEIPPSLDNSYESYHYRPELPIVRESFVQRLREQIKNADDILADTDYQVKCRGSQCLGKKDFFSY